MSKIGILGGTFDPFHLGHEALGKSSIEEVGLDHLILMPTSVSPFKINRKTADECHRMAMLKAFVSSNEKFHLSTYEIDAGKVSYTYDTMQAMRNSMPGDKLYFICGSDAMITIEDWYKGKALLESTSFIVGRRPGVDYFSLRKRVDYYCETYGSDIIILNNTLPEISSSDIRKKISCAGSIENLVPKEIEGYIYDHALYR